VGTFICSIIEIKDLSRACELLTKHGVIVNSIAETMLIVHRPAYGHLGMPSYGQTLSSELSCDVISFSIQTTASCESIEHWHNGVCVRRFVGTDGSFTQIEGEQQAWEVPYFFYEGAEEYFDDEGQLARFQQAVVAGDPTRIFDIAYVGSWNGLGALLQSKGLCFDNPHGSVTPKRSKLWMWILLALLVAVIIGGALKF
jgi:hypothetical protein